MTWTKEQRRAYQREYHKTWYERNKQRKRAQNAEWFARPGNKERWREWRRIHHRDVYGVKQRADQAERVRQNIEIINSIKAGPCTDCGNTFPPCAMDFDHVKPGKRRAVSAMLSGPLEAIFEEIDKCELVCSNCHRVRTFERRQHRWREKRGTHDAS